MLLQNVNILEDGLVCSSSRCSGSQSSSRQTPASAFTPVPTRWRRQVGKWRARFWGTGASSLPIGDLEPYHNHQRNWVTKKSSPQRRDAKGSVDQWPSKSEISSSLQRVNSSEKQRLKFRFQEEQPSSAGILSSSISFGVILLLLGLVVSYFTSLKEHHLWNTSFEEPFCAAIVGENCCCHLCNILRAVSSANPNRRPNWFKNER